MLILTVANHLGARGGLERTQLTTCRALAARGHSIDLFYVSAGDFESQWRQFARTVTPFYGSLPRRAAPVSSFLRIARAVMAAKRLDPDVLYVYRYWDLPFAQAVGHLSGAPVVFHLCLPVPAYLPRWLRPSLRYVRRTLAVSEDTAKRWSTTGLRQERTSVVLTGIDTEVFVPAAAKVRLATRKELAVSEEELAVIYAGRVDRDKGVDVLVKAFRQAHRELPSLHLVVVGGASLGADPDDSERYAAELRALSEDLPVTWLAPRRDVVQLIQAADVAVVPSLWPEPLPRGILEPLACGTPVVASRVGGNPEVMSGWLSEYLFEPGDVEGLCESIVSVARWRSANPELGARCRKEAEQRLSLDKETDAVEAALLGVVRQRRSRV